MNNFFNSTPGGGKVPRNRFDLSHDKKISFRQGYLIPILCKEAVPGDSFRVAHEIMLRLAPLISPAYTRMKVKCESFFVPTRIIWDEFEDWITGGPEGTDAPVPPYFAEADLPALGEHLTEVGSLWDYFGLPCVPDSTSGSDWWPKISVLPFRALALIYDEWYRVPEIEDPIMTVRSSGSQAEAVFKPLMYLQRRYWSRDYFTTCQPNAQRGAAAAAPIDIAYSSTSAVKTAAGGTYVNNTAHTPLIVGGVSQFGGTGTVGGAGTVGRVENIGSASLLIEKFRIARQVQLFLEAMQRGGSRYTEVIWQMFKRKTKDSRLQRPEFIYGNTGNVMISEVLSTVQFEGTSDLPQANMAGHGIHISRGNNWQYTADEHGYFITLMSVVPEGQHYGNGLNSGIEKMWTRSSRYDVYWPLFANLGEQQVLKGEVATQPTLGIIDGPLQYNQVFGYQERYAEYKWSNSTVHGDFRTSLQHWHQNRGWVMSSILTTGPVLNELFLKVGEDSTGDELDRIFAVNSGVSDNLWAVVINDISAVRPMPYHSMPY